MKELQVTDGHSPMFQLTNSTTIPYPTFQNPKDSENRKFLSIYRFITEGTQLIDALCYRPEGRGFDSPDYWDFSLT